MDLTIPETHRALSVRLGERPAIVTPTRTLSWAELDERSRRIGNLLLDSGLRVRTERALLQPHECGQDRVALYLHNGYEYLESMLGAFAARLVPCNVNYRYVESELSSLLLDMDPGAVIFHARFASRLSSALQDTPLQPLLLQVDDGSGTPLLPGALPYERAVAESS